MTQGIRQNIGGSSPYEPVIGFSRAVRVGGSVHVSGTAPVGADGDDVERQAERCFELIGAALSQAGSSLEQVYRTRMYLTHAGDWEAVGRVHGRHFAEVRPAATMVVVAGLLDPRWRVEIEAEAYIAE